MNCATNPLQKPYRLYRELSLIVHALKRRDELTRLVAWAKRKRLVQPLRLYQYRLVDEECRIGFCAVRYTHLMIWAYRVFELYKLFVRRPRYYARGAAAMYRRTT